MLVTLAMTLGAAGPDGHEPALPIGVAVPG